MSEIMDPARFAKIVELADAIIEYFVGTPGCFCVEINIQKKQVVESWPIYKVFCAKVGIMPNESVFYADMPPEEKTALLFKVYLNEWIKTNECEHVWGGMDVRWFFFKPMCGIMIRYKKSIPVELISVLAEKGVIVMFYKEKRD
jgi:hypothetical protein